MYEGIDDSEVKGNGSAPKIAILVAFSGDGGVETGIINLLGEFLARGIQVDLLGIFRKEIPESLLKERPGFKLYDLGVKHTHLALPAVVRYLSSEKPISFLVAKDRAIRLAVVARIISRNKTRLLGQLNTHLSASQKSKPFWQRLARTLPMRIFYPFVDTVIAVSDGVADDTKKLTGLPASRIKVIRNPVIGSDLYEKSQLDPEHAWFTKREGFIILGAGRLTQQKDFPTLIKAFSKVKQKVDRCRLIILGEGPERKSLEELVKALGLENDVALPGHLKNPFSLMARSNLFVLSSKWEGSGNVLTEAMALGVPVVSTDCPSGPAEMLGNGRFGPLVPVGDVDGLATAMISQLENPTDSETLKSAVSEYTISVSAGNYLKELGC